jgi:putative nucleotidyltransferase with HDIG domain
MSASVLRVSNSAYYALTAPVTSVQQAVVVIGPDAVKALVVSASLVEMFKGDRVGRDFQDTFWRHSLAAAFAARRLLCSICPTDVAACELAFTGGLLHDIGKMALYWHNPAAYQAVTKQARAGIEHELGVERKAFGFDHAQVGCALTRKWNLPEELSLAIGHHHDPLTLEDPHRLVDVLHVADALSYHLLADGEEEFVAPALKTEVFDRSGLKLEDVGRHMEELKSEYFNAGTLLCLVRSDA